MHQLRLGNEEVVRDYLQFPEGEPMALELGDLEGLRAMTEALIGRIHGHLESESARAGSP